jgi:hypothetical protein
MDILIAVLLLYTPLAPSCGELIDRFKERTARAHVSFVTRKDQLAWRDARRSSLWQKESELQLIDNKRRPHKRIELVLYEWKNKNRRLGMIKVPVGYKEETLSYTEGVKTTLTYHDGSYIVLHVGGMIKLPFFEGPKYPVTKWRRERHRIVRSGKMLDQELFWSEESSVGVWPPTNIGFSNVPKNRVKIFEKALTSFRRK